MSAVLTIVGSSARAAAQSAARSGFCVHAADMFADEDLRKVADSRQINDYPEGLGRAIAGEQPGTWLYTGALENYPELIGQWQQLRPLLGNPAEVLRRVRDPELVSQTLQAAGLPSPAVSSDSATLPRDGSWLVKPCRSAGGARISRLQSQWRDPSSQSGEYYFQQGIDGESVAAVYLAAAHEVTLLGVTQQLCGEAWGGDSIFRYSGSLGPLALSPTITDQLQRIGTVLHRSFGLVGLFGVDGILQGETIYPVEVNPRYTASVEILERAMDFSAISAHVAACTEGALMSPKQPLRQSGKLIVWAKRRCQVPALTCLMAGLPASLHAAPEVPPLADIPAPGTVIDAGSPIATVLADAERSEEVAELLRVRAAALQIFCPAV